MFTFIEPIEYCQSVFNNKLFILTILSKQYLDLFHPYSVFCLFSSYELLRGSHSNGTFDHHSHCQESIGHHNLHVVHDWQIKKQTYSYKKTNNTARISGNLSKLYCNLFIKITKTKKIKKYWHII